MPLRPFLTLLTGVLAGLLVAFAATAWTSQRLLAVSLGALSACLLAIELRRIARASCHGVEACSGVRALRGAEQALRLQLQELQSANEQLQRTALEDPLTGLLNRRGALQALEAQLVKVQRPCTELAVLLLDVDHFKQVNDTAGHAAGDEVLRNLAFLFTQLCRSTDVVARIGGEEFVVVAPGCELAKAHQIAEDLRQAVQRHSCDWRAGPVTVSIGVAAATGPDMPALALLETADSALYRAKRSGRNCVCLESDTRLAD